MPTASYIGPTSRLLPLEWTTSLEVSQAGRYSIQESASRRWAFVVNGAGRTPPRTWEVNLIASGATMANLEALAGGAWGDEALRWIPESAYVTNALMPAQSLLTGFTGPALEAAQGSAPRSSLGPNLAVLAQGVPVLPNEPCTVSVDASGNSTVLAIFRNAAGEQVDTMSAESIGVLMQRVNVRTFSAPPTARTVDVNVIGHLAVCRPQVTWTRRLMPWEVGGGASSVVIEDLSAGQRHLDGRKGLLYNASMTLTEVG